MAEAAPRVPQVPEGLIFWRTASRSGMAKALALSLLLHGLLLGASAFPRFALSGWPTAEGSRLLGELQPAQATAGSRSADSPVAQEQPEKELPVRPARAPGQNFAAGKQPTAPMAAEAFEPLAVASLSAYRLALARQARKFKQYPQEAPATGVAVEVLVAMRSVPGMPEPVVRLLQSSGNRQLDDAALSMITQAVRLAPLPAELRGRHVQIELPVQFAPDA